MDINEKQRQAGTRLLYQLNDLTRSQLEETIAEANLLVRDNLGNSCLHLALMSQNRSEDTMRWMVELMVKGGAHVNALNQNDESPLLWAIYLAHFSSARVLVDNGANSNVKVGGATLQHFAAASVSPRALEFVWLIFQADFDVIDDEGKTPLMYAAERDHTAHITWLIAHGVDVIQVDPSGEIALFSAVRNRAIQAVWTLLKFEPYKQLRIKNKWGAQASDVAKALGVRTHRDITRLSQRQHNCLYRLFDRVTNNKYRLPTRRWTAYQCKTLFIMLETVVCLQTIYYFMTNDWYLSIVFLGSLCFGIILSITIYFSNPGYIYTTVNSRGLIKGENELLLTPDHIVNYRKAIRYATNEKVCTTCKTVVPVRSKHCRELDRCVYRYDHYCPFVGTTIGSSNHALYLIFLLWYLLLSAQYFFLFYRYMALSNLYGTLELLFTWAVAACCVLISLFDLWMLSTQMYLVCKNLTTNEFINFERYNYLLEDGVFRNPYDRGIILNCSEFWCGSKNEG